MGYAGSEDLPQRLFRIWQSHMLASNSKLEFWNVAAVDPGPSP
jgi:hypothetical protein